MSAELYPYLYGFLNFHYRVSASGKLLRFVLAICNQVTVFRSMLGQHVEQRREFKIYEFGHLLGIRIKVLQTSCAVE